MSDNQPLQDVVVVVPPDFDTEDGPCVICGGELDTGWECNDCGADHRPAVMMLLSRNETKH